MIKKSLANKIWKCTRENDRISLFVIDSPRHFVVFRLSCLEKHNLHFPWISLWKKRDRKQNSVLTTTDSTIYSESLCLWFQLPVFNLVYMEEHKVQDWPCHKTIWELEGFRDLPDSMLHTGSAFQQLQERLSPHYCLQNYMIPFVGHVDASEMEVEPCFPKSMESNPIPVAFFITRLSPTEKDFYASNLLIKLTLDGTLLLAPPICSKSAHTVPGQEG